MVAVDAGAFLGFLAERPEVAGPGVGTTGYCMGGRTSLITVGRIRSGWGRGSLVPRRAARPW